MKEILEKFNNLNDQTRYAIFVGVIMVILILDVFIGVLPQLGSISDTNDQIKKMSDDTQQVIADKGRINLLRKNLKKERIELNSLTKKVHPIQEVPAILTAISRIANEYGVKIDQLLPEKTQQEAIKAAPTDGKYYVLPVEIKARCGYHQFGRFLNKMENKGAFFILKDFIIQDDEKNPTMHLFSLTIQMILVDRGMNQSNNL